MWPPALSKLLLRIVGCRFLRLRPPVINFSPLKSYVNYSNLSQGFGVHQVLWDLGEITGGSSLWMSVDKVNVVFQKHVKKFLRNARLDNQIELQKPTEADGLQGCGLWKPIITGRNENVHELNPIIQIWIEMPGASSISLCSKLYSWTLDLFLQLQALLGLLPGSWLSWRQNQLNIVHLEL